MGGRGLPLAWHLCGKSKGNGEDPRYETLLGANPSGATVVRKIFLLQAAATFVISLPLQVSASSGPTRLHSFPGPPCSRWCPRC